MKQQPRYSKGQRIANRFLVHQARMGGMGEVYLCIDEKENNPLALKTFQGSSPDLADIFKKEVSGSSANYVESWIEVQMDYPETLGPSSAFGSSSSASFRSAFPVFRSYRPSRPMTVCAFTPPARHRPPPVPPVDSVQPIRIVGMYASRRICPVSTSASHLC